MPILMFVGEARSLPKRGASERPYLQTLDQARELAGDKYYHLYETSLFKDGHNKMECLSLAGLSSLF